MNNKELLEVLQIINETRENKIEKEVIEQVLSIVIMNPLIEDRARCQDQLIALINQRIK